MARILAYLGLRAALFAPSGFGQSGVADSPPAPLWPRGLHIYEASVYSGYSTLAYPVTGIEANYSSQISGLGGDWSYGGLVTLGWQQLGPKSTLSMIYTGGYGGMVHYSGVNGMSQSLAFGYSRTLGGRWTASLSASGQDNTLAQYLFQPARYSTITQSATSFDDFAAAFSIGQYSNAQIASMLTGAPILESPAQNLLLGNRILSYSVQTGVEYSYSSRLKLHLSSFSASGQTQSSGNDVNVRQNYVMPRSTGLNGGVGFSYSLSPRTEVGVDAGEYMVWNRFQSARGTSVTASLGRKMSRRWFLRIRGGGSDTQILDYTASGKPIARQLIGGGSLGTKTYSHTFVADYDRSSFDSYGFAVGTSIVESGSWQWQHPGSRWSTFASFGEQQLRNTGFLSISGWQAAGGVRVQLQREAAVTIMYSHLRSAGTYNGMYNEFSVDGIRLSLAWTPVQGVH